MRTSTINKLTRGIFFVFLVLMLTACTSREDIMLELDGSRAENMPESEEASETEGDSEAETGTEPGQGTEPESSITASDTGSSSAVQEVILPDIYVHICGAVENPGVYILGAGSRVYEGVAAAGGFREDACEDFINLAGILQDGERLAIPTMEEAEAAKADGSYQALWKEAEDARQVGNLDNNSAAENASGGIEGLVNINTASEKELSAIPGIGTGKAAAIVQYRQENGRFTSIEDIMKVNGIKEGTFEKIKDRITVN